jgi:enediyne biosynthesis protein E4
MGVEAGCAFNEDGREQGGMGTAVGDYDGDGRLDILKTNFSDDTVSLYRNLGGGQFEDATARAGISGNTRFLGWGAGLVDLDNDGWKDIFLVNGHIYPEVHSWFPRLHYKDRKVVYRNLGNGRYTEVSEQSGPGVMLERSARGCAFGDFDNDGDLDVVVNNINDLPSLLRNDLKHGSAGNHWIKIKCVGTTSNRTAIGARVRVTSGGRTQMDEVQSGGSYISQNDLRLHFGLGSAASVDRVEVRWPTGKIQSFQNLTPNRIYRITENAGLVPI